MDINNLEIKCNGCGRVPNKIEEYIESAKEINISPSLYVMIEEGTYNPSNGHFYCTSCYIRLGMPLGKAK